MTLKNWNGNKNIILVSNPYRISMLEETKEHGTIIYFEGGLGIQVENSVREICEIMLNHAGSAYFQLKELLGEPGETK